MRKDMMPRTTGRGRWNAHDMLDISGGAHMLRTLPRMSAAWTDPDAQHTSVTAIGRHSWDAETLVTRTHRKELASRKSPTLNRH